jgi:hypothetical protein
VLSRDKLECGLLVAAVALTRFLFRSHYLYDIDSVNFALAIQRFDPGAHQPHPPGYFLYVYLARLANTVFHDANAALVAISIASSCGVALMIHALARHWFGPRAAKFAGLVFLFSPLAWFHGTVALTYIVEAFFSALVGYLCWRVYTGATALVVPCAVVAGFAAGVRPSFLLFLGPLFLFSMRRVPGKQAAAAIGVLGLTLLAWFIPLVRESGGLGPYVSSFVSLWRIAPAKATVFNSSPLTSIARFCTIAGIYALCFGCAAFLPFALWGGRPRPRRTPSPGLLASSIERLPSKTGFTWIWIAPGLLFFTLIFLRFVNSGYLLVLFPPVCVWLGHWGAEWYAERRWSKPLKDGVVVFAAASNVAIFLFAPAYCSYASVRRFETELRGIQTALPQIVSPRETLIVGFDSHFLGYRHAGYYLPEYSTVQYPEVRLLAGKRVFAMQHRDTKLASRLPVAAYRNFILFPLPSDDQEYRDFAKQVRARFPERDLRAIQAGGHEFIIGPIADLPLLFPVVAARSNSSFAAAESTP